MDRKGKKIIKTVSVEDYFKDFNYIKEIYSQWLSGGISVNYSDLLQSEKNDIIKILDKVNFNDVFKNKKEQYKELSEVRASKYYSDEHNSLLIWSNIRFNVINGEAHGIDLIHKSKDGKVIDVIEVKFTEDNVSGMLVDAKKQLDSRFGISKPQQLKKAIEIAIKDKLIDKNHPIVKYIEHPTETIPENTLLVPLIVSTTKTDIKEDDKYYEYYIFIDNEKGLK